MQKITPCLWFDKNCEEAVNFYVTVFPNSKISSIKRYPEGMSEGPMQGMEGKVLTAIFELDGLVFQALDGGPIFKINPAISFMVNFDPSRNPNAAKDLDAMWTRLAEGGTVRMPKQEYPYSKQYGWVEDRFGVNWQLIQTDPKGEPRPAIIPSLLFTQNLSGKAEEAALFYVSVFKNSNMGTIVKFPEDTPVQKKGEVMFEEFHLENQWFTAMDGGGGDIHAYKFNEAVSLSIETADQTETDYFWEQLSAVPESEQCGWVKDRYGVSWQIIPKRMGELISDPDPEKSNRVLRAMLQMKKIDIAGLERAYSDN